MSFRRQFKAISSVSTQLVPIVCRYGPKTSPANKIMFLPSPVLVSVASLPSPQKKDKDYFQTNNSLRNPRKQLHLQPLNQIIPPNPKKPKPKPKVLYDPKTSPASVPKVIFHPPEVTHPMQRTHMIIPEKKR